MAAAAAVCSRRSNRSSPSGVSDVDTSTRTTPGTAWVLTGKPLSRNTLIILMVVGQDLGAEHPDAGLVGGLGELAEQDRAQPFALHGVGDRQGDLGPLGPVRVPLPAGVGQHPAVAAGRDQAVAPLVVDLGGPADGAVEVGEAGEEPQPSRLRRQALEERAHGRRVGGSDRPHVHGRAIPQGHVDLAVPRVRHLHHSSVDHDVLTRMPPLAPLRPSLAAPP